ncbi:MAG: pyridoxamine 5'-phosphate oxidase [Pseudomonadota bacterium]|jgi:pyridoxamine 5'-phosphate oxidase
MSDRFSKTRVEYQKGELDIDSIDRDPFRQFHTWFDEATKSEPYEPNACALATVGNDLQPSVRMVLLKALDERGFVFFSNYCSRKGKDLEANERAALVFYWGSLERQVRIEGRVERVSEAESDRYFAARPRDSQFGSAVSAQSSVAKSRQELEQAMQHLRQVVGDGPVPRPPNWGGYRMIPAMFEFWQGRENRLHDRIRFIINGDAQWILERLWP